MGWTVLVPIINGTTNTRGIGLLENLWKVVEALIDTRLSASLYMHNILHGFRARRGTGTAIIELNLTQEISSIDQDHLLLVLLDLRKAYGTVDQDRLLITLEGYVGVPRLCGLLETFWYCHQVVPNQNGFRGPAFHAKKGTIQGGLVSLIMFNVVVENFIKTWLVMLVEYHRVDHDGMGETVGRCLLVFYADNGMDGSHESDWIHHATDIMVGLFRRYGLAANVSKSRIMTCQAGALRAGMSEEAMAFKCTGVGDSY